MTGVDMEFEAKIVKRDRIITSLLRQKVVAFAMMTKLIGAVQEDQLEEYEDTVKFVESYLQDRDLKNLSHADYDVHVLREEFRVIHESRQMLTIL